MSHGKQFTLYMHTLGPNGWKVAFVMAELGLTYESIYLDFRKGEQKAPEHTKYNPNGRIPTIIDHHNDDFVVWESAAILMYLVEKYDTEHKISVTDPKEKIIQLQWLAFQISGQGPYYGQAVWFQKFHPEKFPSAAERYQKETYRVLGVLESVLSKQEWLVGGKTTIADIAFVPWNTCVVPQILKDYNGFDFGKDFPAVFAWHEKIMARPAIKDVWAQEQALN
ncbi:glutathione S-transferase [Obba rivulosa]|uniref:glutathione transferase n=1 Tax=Obba rivulosa TaxID=1052685 RepID=A0A8E2DF53_9APHY|nr:glutathione S-transferase [Obba rivulosa]